MFFEINLPLVAPNHIKNEEFRTRMSITLQRVHRRMRLLENALQESGLRGEVFSAGIRKMFNTEEEKPKLDTMTASEIACAELQYGAKPVRVAERSYCGRYGLRDTP